MFNKTGLLPVSRPVEKVPLFKGWGVGTKSLVVNAGQTDRQTDRQTYYNWSCSVMVRAFAL